MHLLRCTLVMSAAYRLVLSVGVPSDLTLSDGGGARKVKTCAAGVAGHEEHKARLGLVKIAPNLIALCY